MKAIQEDDEKHTHLSMIHGHHTYLRYLEFPFTIEPT